MPRKIKAETKQKVLNYIKKNYPEGTPKYKIRDATGVWWYSLSSILDEMEEAGIIVQIKVCDGSKTIHKYVFKSKHPLLFRIKRLFE